MPGTFSQLRETHAVSPVHRYMWRMLSVIIATDGQEPPAVATLAPLVPGAAAGLIREVLLVDRAASETIARVADVAGCAYLGASGPRAAAYAAGAAKAHSPWLLFLPAGAVLDPSWIDETAQFMQSVAMSGKPRAGYFSYARSPYAEPDWRDRLRTLARLFGQPSPSQGLLIARDHFRRLGGFDVKAARPESALQRKLRQARMQLRTGIVSHHSDS